VRKVGDRVVPQYFVMVGGGVDDDGAHFARLAAKIPGRRMVETLERLVACYERKRVPGESASAYFRRVDVSEVRSLLADLEALDPARAEPLDFVDLGEDTEFKVQVMEGECAT
jgi:sulfite reductase (NADPH) hemoprotein beta-component